MYCNHVFLWDFSAMTHRSIFLKVFVTWPIDLISRDSIRGRRSSECGVRGCAVWGSGDGSSGSKKTRGFKSGIHLDPFFECWESLSFIRWRYETSVFLGSYWSIWSLNSWLLQKCTYFLKCGEMMRTTKLLRWIGQCHHHWEWQGLRLGCKTCMAQPIKMKIAVTEKVRLANLQVAWACMTTMWGTAQIRRCGSWFNTKTWWGEWQNTARCFSKF